MSLTPTGRTVHTTASDGTIHDWLVSPVWSIPCEDLDEFLAADGEPWGDDGRWVLTNGPDVGPFKERLLANPPFPEDLDLPGIGEGNPLRWRFRGTDVAGTWGRVHTGWDGYLDWSAFCFTPEYRASLAATAIEVDQSEWRTIELATTGPFIMWLDGDVVMRGTTVSYMEPEVHQTRVRVPSGTSTIHIATWQVAFRECRHIVRVRMLGLPVRVVIPSQGADEYVSAWGEAILNRIGSPSWALESATAELRGPRGVNLKVRVSEGAWQRITTDSSGRATYRLISPQEVDDEGGDVARSAGASMLSSGESIVEVMIDDDRCPVFRSWRIASLPTTSTEFPAGDASQWRHDVLSFISSTGDDNSAPRERGVAGVLTRHALDAGTMVEEADLASALHRVETRGDCADFEAIALLWAWHVIGEKHWSEQLRRRTRDALTGLKYWITQPGLDAMCYFTENHQFVWHVAQYLAGMAFLDDTFAIDGRSGREHSAEARVRAAGWMERKLEGGFSEFDSNAYLAIDTYALVSLIDLGADDDLRVAATTLLDKCLVTLASNSWRGIHGAAHGRSYVHTLRSSRYEETSPILRLVAGIGTLNDAVLPVTALALSRRYRIPEVVRAIASEPVEAWWGRQVYDGRLRFERDLLDRPYRSDLRVWRTPSVMLSSVQDYRRGLPGLQEHIWGATLGRECQVFMTHPANADTGSSARPNGWAGQRVLPRVHQYRNALMGIQRFTPSDPKQSTHLWFPLAQFDWHGVVGDWVVGRLGEGFVAVATPGGFVPMSTGETMGQEWLPRVDGCRWVAIVGGGSLEEFDSWVNEVTASDVEWYSDDAEHASMAWAVPGGARLELSFDGAFMIDGVPDCLRDGSFGDPPHLDNPAVRLAFGQEEAVVDWGGKSHTLAIGQALRAARRAGGVT